MDLNELLSAHQREVMKFKGSLDEEHARMIAEYADRIGKLRPMKETESVVSDPDGPPTLVYGTYAGAAAADFSVIALPAVALPVAEANENPDRGKADD